MNYPYTGVLLCGNPAFHRNPCHCNATAIAVATLCLASLFSATYLCAALIWVFWQSVGQTALQPFYFAFPLGFPLAGALAAMVAIMVAREVKPVALTLFALCFAAMTIIAVHEADAIDRVCR